ncbi:MAG: dipeptidase [Gemmataceae bacterium]
MARVFALFLALYAWFLPSQLIAEESKSPRDKAPRGMVKLTPLALQIHKSAILVDGHNDLPWAMREGNNKFRSIDIRKPQPKLHTDIPRLKKGNVGMQFWSAYVPASTRAKKTAVKLTLEQIDLIHRMVQTYPDVFEMAKTVDDIYRIRKKGKIASMIGVEGGHSIANSLGVLRLYHKLGVRYMTLTHSETLDWADSATDDPKSNGLSQFGEGVVREMNRLGMLVDISHVSVETMEDVLRVTKAPIIASHSSAYTVAKHARNVPDQVLKKLKKNGGVVMVNFYSGFVVPEAARSMKHMFQVYRDLKKQYPKKEDFQQAWSQWKAKHPVPKGTVHDVVDHIEHIIKVAGIDHVGIGSDYDGVSSLPSQLEDVSCYPYITQELLNRGYNRKQIHKVLGDNLLRAFQQAERVAKNWTN